ncbi:hypothetical protein OROGR_023290 [Orobanche gracilis]
MRGSKCSINGYVRLGIVKTIIAELRSVGDDTIMEFRESCLGHFIREEWGVDEFWFRSVIIDSVLYEYALVTGLRFGDSEFDVHVDDVPPEGSVYDRYPLLNRGGQMLDRIRDRFAGGYFREQPDDALKVAKVLCVCYLIFGVDGGKRIADRWLWMLVEDQTRWESFPWGLYSYQILVTYLSDVPTEVPAGLDPSYHFYGNVYAIMIWACEAIPSLGSKCGITLGASFIQRPRCTRWKLKKLGHIDFTTFFDDEIDCFEVLSPTPEEEREPYMQSISNAASERRQSSLIRAPCQTASSSARGTQETAPITDFDTLFTRLHTCIQSAVQEMRQYVDAVVEKSVNNVCRHIDESSLLTETHVDGALSPTEQSEEVPSPGRAPVIPKHTLSLDQHADGGSVLTECTRSPDHQASVSIVTPRVIPTDMLVTPPEIAPRTRPSSSTADLSPIPLEYSSITIREDTYHSPRLQYRSYRPHPLFSTTVVRKRKDLDEEAYSDSYESVNVGAACGASAFWFTMLQDTSTLIDAEFDPGFVGVRWLDDWRTQTVLVHTSFLATCINVWNNSMSKGGPLSIDDEDLDFLVSHIHDLRPFWGDHRPWWELREVLTIWNTSLESSCGHWLVIRIRLEEGIIIMHDSLAQEEDAYLKLRSHQSLGFLNSYHSTAFWILRASR